SKLPAEVRLAAFEMLRPHIRFDSQMSAGDSNVSETGNSAAESGSLESLLQLHTHDKPADNVKLIAAFLYSRFGTEPFSLDELRELANNAGLTIPARPDMTIKAALEEGKKLFHSPARDKYAPTVHGELFLKKTYSVRKGANKR